MKHFFSLLIFALLTAGIFAQVPYKSAFFPSKTVLVANPGITVDLWQTFENATLSAGNLATTDHNGTGTWTVTDASSKLSVVSAGETATISQVGGVSDTGTLGLGYSLSGGIQGYIDYAPAIAKTDIVIGFWYTTCTPANFDQGPDVMQIWDDGNGSCLKLRDEKDAGSNTRELTVISSSTIHMTTGVANNTKYWISVRFVKNGTGKVAIYNSSGVQQGSTTDVTCPNFSVNRIYFGNRATITTQAQTVYIDDVVLKWTSPTNTIGP